MFDSLRNRLVAILSILMVSQASVSFSQSREWVAKYTAGCKNYLYISGESNINQFSFSYNDATYPGQYIITAGDTQNITISIPIRDFQPSNPMMYGDFLVLMKESEFPIINVSFSKQQLQSTKWDLPGSCPDIRITIAGITRTYKIQCSIVKCSDNLYLCGDKTIKLSDFQLKPPEKMLGLVKVNNEINVNFGFIITFTDINPLSAIL
jgi:hypothetical protein